MDNEPSNQMEEPISMQKVNQDYLLYCKFGNFHEGFSFMKIKPSRNSKITLSFTNICKFFLSCELRASQICLLTHICENKILAKFSDLQYIGRGLSNALVVFGPVCNKPTPPPPPKKKQTKKQQPRPHGYKTIMLNSTESRVQWLCL